MKFEYEQTGQSKMILSVTPINLFKFPQS